MAFAPGLPEAQARDVVTEITRLVPRPGEVSIRRGKPRGEFPSDKVNLLLRFSPSPRNVNAVVAESPRRPGVADVQPRLMQFP